MAKRGRKKGTRKFLIGGQEVYLSPKMQVQHGFQKKRGRPRLDEAVTQRMPTQTMLSMVYQPEHVPTVRGIGGVGVVKRGRGRPKGSKNKPKAIEQMTKAQLIKMLKGG